MYHHIVEAMFEAGLKKDAIDLMKSYWGKMISLGADTYREAFDPDQRVRGGNRKYWISLEEKKGLIGQDA